MEYLEQTPLLPNEWLYKNERDDRLFAKQISYRSDKGTPWNECTDAEKVAWEEMVAERDKVEEHEINNM